MPVRYVMLDLPPPLMKLRVTEDLNYQIRQRELFRLRAKLGPEAVPAVYQPHFESEESLLCAVFVAPGEVHLVFKDEVAPAKAWDEWYRRFRIDNLGRASDIESIEVTEDEVFYHWCYSFANLYESGLHYSGRQDWNGSIYSHTWNHMLTNGASLPILLRGGYRKMEPVIYSGDREAAEVYARSI